MGINAIFDFVDVGIGIFTGRGSVGAIISGTKMLINAQTAKQLLCEFAKRYAGWIGVGYTYISSEYG